MNSAFPRNQRRNTQTSAAPRNPVQVRRRLAAAVVGALAILGGSGLQTYYTMQRPGMIRNSKKTGNVYSYRDTWIQNLQSGLKRALNNKSSDFSIYNNAHVKQLSMEQPSLHQLIVNVRKSPHTGLGVLENCVHDKVKERKFLEGEIKRKILQYEKVLGPAWKEMPREKLAQQDEYTMAPGTQILRYGVAGASIRTSMPGMQPQEHGATHHGIYLFDGIVVDVGSSPDSCAHPHISHFLSMSNNKYGKGPRSSSMPAFITKLLPGKEKGINHFIGITSLYKFSRGYNDVLYDVYKYDYASSTAPIMQIFRDIVKNIGVKPYDLFERNCEHWASSILTGVPFSGQALFWKTQFKRWHWYVLGAFVSAIMVQFKVPRKEAEAIANNQCMPDSRFMRPPNSASSRVHSSPNSNSSSNSNSNSNATATTQRRRSSKRLQTLAKRQTRPKQRGN